MTLPTPTSAQQTDAPAPDRPLRIHFFTSHVHEQGTYFRTHNLAVGLVQLGHLVTVYSCDQNDKSKKRTEDRDGVIYDIVPESWKTSIFSKANHPLTAARRFVRGYPACDIAHLFQPLFGAAAAWRGGSALAHLYDWDDLWTGGLSSGKVQLWRERWPRFIVRQLEEKLPRRAAHVTAVSKYLANMALARGVRGASVVYNGYWPDTSVDRAIARARVGLRQDAFYVGFMGRTTAELEWCFAAVAESAAQYPALRFALCGPPASALEGLPSAVRERVDYLGQLSAAQCRDFAAALDLGLLPLDDTPFNQSRYPIKFCDHLSTGVPLLCSEIGEVGHLAQLFPWAIRAGRSRADWLREFPAAVERLSSGNCPVSTPSLLAEKLSWPFLAGQLLSIYREVLATTEPGSRAPAAAVRR